MVWTFQAGNGIANDPNEHDSLIQTGIDVDLSGLIAVVGGTGPGNYWNRLTKGKKLVYQQNTTEADTTLRIEGDLTLDPETEELWFDNTAATTTLGATIGDKTITIASGGIFRIGTESTVRGTTRYSNGDAIVGARDHRPQFSINFIEVQSGGQLIHNGGVIYHGNANGVRSGGNVVINEGRYVNLDDNSASQFMRADNDADITINAVELDTLFTDQPNVLFVTNGSTNISGVRMRGAAIQNRNGAYTGIMDLSNFEFAQNAADVDVELFATTANEQQVQPVELTNSDVGSDVRVGQIGTQITKRGYVGLFKEVDAKVVDTSDVNVALARMIIVSTDDGNRDNPGTDPAFRNNRDFLSTDYDIYSGFSNASGETLVFNVLLAVKWDDSQTLILVEESFYGETGISGEDQFTAHFWSHAHLHNDIVANLTGTGKLTFRPVMIPDAFVTETDALVVNSYGRLEHLDKVYDRAKLWKTATEDNAQYPALNLQVFNGSGNTMVFDPSVGHDLLITASGAPVADPFVRDSGLATFTIDAGDAPIFTSGSTFDHLDVGSNVLVFTNTAVKPDTVELSAASVQMQEAVDLNAVTINGEFEIVGGSVDVTVDWKACSIDTFRNSSGQTITINLTSGTPVPTTTIDVGGSVTIYVNNQNVTITNLVPTSSVSIIATTGGPAADGTVLYNVSVPGTSTTYVHNYSADQPVIVRIRKASAAPFYKPQTLLGTISSTGLSLIANQILD